MYSLIGILGSSEGGLVGHSTTIRNSDKYFYSQKINLPNISSKSPQKEAFNSMLR